jgi:hypothetical protein
MGDLEMLKLLPASIIPAALVLVFMFRELNKRESIAVDLAHDFIKHTDAKDKEHREQINVLIDRFQAAQLVFMAQQKAIIDDYILVTKETVIAVKGLEASVRELKNYVASQRPGTWDERVEWRKANAKE